MQGDAGLQRQRAFRQLLRRVVVQRVDGGHRSLRRLQGAGGGVLGVVLDRENRQKAVADEFQNFAAFLHHRSGQRAEIEVQHLADLFLGHPLGPVGEPSEVADPDHSLDPPTSATLDLPRQNLGAGAGAQIGVQDIGRDAVGDVAFNEKREEIEDIGQRLELLFRESARLRRRHGAGVVIVAAAAQRPGEVVGDAVRADLFDQRIPRRIFRVLGRRAHGSPVRHHLIERVQLVRGHQRRLFLDDDLVQKAIAQLKIEPIAGQLRMKRADMQGRPR